MAKVGGSFVRLSLPRRIIGHFLSGTPNIPLVTGQRTFRLAEVIAARAEARPRPSMAALFIKAFASVCAREPELRRTLVSWPWTRMFQYDIPIVSMVVEREYDGEPGLFLARFKNAHQRSLVDLQEELNRCKSEPVESIRGFRNALRLARFPGFMRHPVWWLITRTMPRLKAGLLGTHGISPTIGMRVRGIHIVTPWTIAMHYDTPGDDGEMDVRFTFDHRVYDAAVLAMALGSIEQELRGPILAELRGMIAAHPALRERRAA